MSMYAIAVIGGKQYKIKENDVIRIEKINALVGDVVEFNNVLMIVDKESNVIIGTPNISNVKISGEVNEQGRGEKIHIIKFRRRKHYMRHQGHRQYYTEVKINSIQHIV